MEDINKKLNSIRSIIDMEVSKDDIEGVKEKIIKLQLCEGISAECKAHSKKLFDIALVNKIKSFQDGDKNLPPSVLLKQSTLECYEESAVYEYADRINAAIHHSVDGLRSILSAYKEEIKLM